MAERIDLNERAERIMQIAEAYGAEKNFLFVLDNLMDEIRDGGSTVTKEYVKGRENRYVNPAIPEYNKTMKTFNDTVATLMKIIEGFKADEERDDEDPLLAVLRGD